MAAYTSLLFSYQLTFKSSLNAKKTQTNKPKPTQSNKTKTHNKITTNQQHQKRKTQKTKSP